MKRLGELGILPAILQSPALPCLPPPKTQSLLDMISSLSLIASPPQRHGGICDFTPAFRAAIRDIYESVPGLTLFDVSGKRGWALSKNRSARHSEQSQGNGATGAGEQLFKVAQQRYAPEDHHQHQHDHRRSPISSLGASGGSDGHDHDHDHDRDDVCLFKILSLLDDPRDLRAAAMINKRFYRSYLRNERRLWQGIRAAPTGNNTAAPRRRADIAEVDGTPYGARASAPDSGAEPGVGGAGMICDPAGSGCSARPREKFRLGQVLLVEDKRLVEDDAEKYAGHIREPLLLGRGDKGGRGIGLGARLCGVESMGKYRSRD